MVLLSEKKMRNIFFFSKFYLKKKIIATDETLIIDSLCLSSLNFKYFSSTKGQNRDTEAFFIVSLHAHFLKWQSYKVCVTQIRQRKLQKSK